jgi:hypothetical protein
MLLKVEGSDPWYANIVNFLVAGYVPPGVEASRPRELVSAIDDNALLP